MIVCPAELQDLEACLNLDHSYLTEPVWPMDLQEGKSGATINFRTVRLPRPVHVRYPRDRPTLLADWHKKDCFLVATAGESEQEDQVRPIVGYLTMGASEWNGAGWVADLVVAPEHRRRGVASQLLQAGKGWAREAGLRRLIVETQTKNHPAMCFLDRHGFTFCGYNDHYYANRDIALFFSLDLR
jgi:ribosomal protein S18 acetylase RimI-like enzyme